MVIAKDGEAKAFYTKYGFQELSDDCLHLYLPIRILKKLDIL